MEADMMNDTCPPFFRQKTILRTL